MVIDSSAIVCVLLEEPEASRVRVAIDADPVRLVSATSLVETGMVIEACAGAEGTRLLDRLLREMDVEALAFDRRQADVALDAWRRFGKGRHPAALNLGDCFSFAAAQTTGEPLLCIGGDFTKTDLALVAW